MRVNLTRIQTLTKNYLDYSIYAGIVLLSILIYLASPAWMNQANLYIQDEMMGERKIHDPGADVVIVAIDDSSLTNLGKWPWDREILAQLIWTVNLAKPKTIGLDLNLSLDVTQDTLGHTQLLAEIVKEVGNVVMPIYFSFSEVGMDFPETPIFITKSAWDFNLNEEMGLNLPTGTKRVFYPDPKIAKTAYRLGHVNLFPGKGNKIRDEKLFLEYGGKIYPSFAFQIAQRYVRAEASIKDGNRLFLKDYSVPMEKNGDFRINYNGPNGTFRHFSAWKVLNGKINATDLYDKAVLVGLTNSLNTNRILTPASIEEMDEVERVANVVENLIHKNFLTNMKLSSLWNILIAMVIGIFCAASFPRVTWVYRWAVVVILVFMVIYLIPNFLLSSFNLLSQPSYHILELVLFAISAPLIDYTKPPIQKKREEKEFEEEEEKEKEKDEERYVSPVELAAAPVRVIKEQEHTDKFEVGSPKNNVSPAEDSDAAFSSSELSVEKMTKSTTSSLDKSTSHIGIKQFGRYKILGLLGKGAMGTVYKGEDPAIGRPVALKTIRIDFSEDEEEVNELRERLMREAQAAGKMSHPNIVTVYDVGQEGDFQYIAMEYLEGYTLESYLRKKGELNYKILAKIIMQVCEALSYAHSKGIIHRDIKPANIMILDNFEVKVMDFGIARFGVSSMTQVGTAMGTPNYISPEQLEGKTADKRSDIFSLGVILYEFLTGQKPFKGESISALAYSIINDNPPSPSNINDKTPLIFDRVVAKAMAKDPNERYQNAEEITKTLKEFIASFVVNRSVKL